MESLADNERLYLSQPQWFDTNKDIVFVKGDKDSSTAIMKKSDYIAKVETMIHDGIRNY